MTVQKFLEHFLPALLVGLIILGATLYAQSKPEQSGLLLYNQQSFDVRNPAAISTSANSGKVENKSWEGAALVYIDIINAGDTDLSNFKITLDGFRPSDKSSVLIDTQFNGVVTSKPLSNSSIDDDGIMRLNFDRFDRNGNVRIVLTANSLPNLDLQTDDKQIELVKMYASNIQQREIPNSTLPFVVSFLATFLGLGASVFFASRAKKATGDD